MMRGLQQLMQRQQQLYPTVSPPPADFMNAMASLMSGALWVAALIAIGVAVVAVIGALSRWTWIYYAILVFLGLGAISLPLDLINAVGGSAFSGVSVMPSWFYWLGLVAAIPGTALFVWMLVALVKRGPWAMKKVAA